MRTAVIGNCNPLGLGFRVQPLRNAMMKINYCDSPRLFYCWDFKELKNKFQ